VSIPPSRTAHLRLSRDITSGIEIGIPLSCRMSRLESHTSIQKYQIEAGFSHQRRPSLRELLLPLPIAKSTSLGDRWEFLTAFIFERVLFLGVVSDRRQAILVRHLPVTVPQLPLSHPESP
jgi:hypothetical protein